MVVLRMEDLRTDFFLGMLLAADVAGCCWFEGGAEEDDATGPSVVAHGIVQVMLSSSSITPRSLLHDFPQDFPDPSRTRSSRPFLLRPLKKQKIPD